MHIRQGTTKPLVRPDQTNKVKGNNKKGGKERMKRGLVWRFSA